MWILKKVASAMTCHIPILHWAYVSNQATCQIRRTKLAQNGKMNMNMLWQIIKDVIQYEYMKIASKNVRYCPVKILKIQLLLNSNIKNGTCCSLKWIMFIMFMFMSPFLRSYLAWFVINSKTNNGIFHFFPARFSYQIFSKLVG